MLLWAEMCDKDNGEEETNELFARLNLNHHMAYYVAKKLHIAPREILTEWSCPELLVAYGQYMNEDSYKNWSAWDDQPKKSRGKEPEKVAVKFINPAEDGE